MDARRLIAQLCSRFRVSRDFARRLLPLAERALQAEPEKRRRMLAMIERSFAAEARAVALERAGVSDDDWRALTTVAGVLHGWNPPAWFERWEDDRPRPA